MNSSSMIICHSELDESVRNTDNYMRVYAYIYIQENKYSYCKVFRIISNYNDE